MPNCALLCIMLVMFINSIQPSTWLVKFKCVSVLATHVTWNVDYVENDAMF